MTTLTLELPEPLDAQLTELAKRRNVSKTVVAEIALQNYLQRESVKPTRRQLENHLRQHGTPAPESFAAKAEKYLGIAAGGASDLSSNPAHLEGFGK